MTHNQKLKYLSGLLSVDCCIYHGVAHYNSTGSEIAVELTPKYSHSGKLQLTADEIDSMGNTDEYLWLGVGTLRATIRLWRVDEFGKQITIEQFFKGTEDETDNPHVVNNSSHLPLYDPEKDGGGVWYFEPYPCL